MAYSDDRTPEQIEREIEQTRQDTAATIAAIEERLSPGRLMDDAWTWMRSSGQGQTFMANLTQTVRDNPIPVALMAISVAWLAIAGSRKEQSRGRIGSAGYVDPDTHHAHVSSSRPNGPEGRAPSPDTLLGRERSGLSAGEAARVFEAPDSASGTSTTQTSTLVTPTAANLTRPG